MSTMKNPNRKWLPLALVPLFSVSVLVGCSSDDDDDVTPPPPSNVVAGDADGNGVPDAFESADTAMDANGNNVVDQYETPADAAVAAADTNNNFVDDSYEVALTMGTDANADGIDDAAAALLAGGTGGETGGEGSETGGEGSETGGEGGGGETTNTLAPVVLRDTSGTEGGTANLDWDGTNLTGTVDLADGVTATQVAIYTGISAAGNGANPLILNGGPTNYSFPSPLSADQMALITDNIEFGNLYAQIDKSDGNPAKGDILLPGVTAKYVDLQSGNSVPSVDAFSNAAGFININTASGKIAATINVNLNPEDGETISMAHIHLGGPGETGAPIVTLENTNGDGVTWSATATLSTADLSSMQQGNTYFNVHGADQAGFLRGQIPGF